MDINCENYCRDCNHKWGETRIEEGYECPKCFGRNIHKSKSISCTCGKDVNLSDFTNECECGKLYNGFGEELADKEDWDDDDRYDCFGPQNYEEEY